MDRGVSTEHVQSVLAIEDRVLRNYWVTQTYSDLSAGLTSLLQPDTANWCTFGTWASCTVGRNLRGEALPDWLHHRVVLSDGMMGAARKANAALRDARLDGGFHCIGSEHLIDILRERFGACATNLSDGNTEVFAEIGPAAATFLSCFAGDPQNPASARATVLHACEGAPVFEGRNRLRAGFEHWCDALAESDSTRRSQLILAGSLELGAHEQHHLQEPIAGSMDMGLNETVALLERRLTKDASGPPAIAEAVDVLLYPLGHAISDLWGDLMTELLGTIETPDGTLRLNRDVPPLPGQPFVAPDLTPVVVDDLATLFERYDLATGDGRGSRALDWVDLNGRMNFIANLFQSRHHRKELFQPPFGTDVLAQIEAGRIPVTPSRSVERGGVRSGDGVKRLQQVIPPSRGTKMFTDAMVEKLRVTGDAPADAAVAEFFKATDVMVEKFRVTGDAPADAAVVEFFKATDVAHSTLFRRLTSTSVGAPIDEDLPGIGAFARLEEKWPDWANPELVCDGQQVFGEFGPQLGMGLFMASLPADYAFAKGVQALGRTARLTRDPKRRYVETGQMIIDVMTPGALDPGRSGYRAVRHVRLMHAAVRHVLLHLAEIERDPLVPIEPWDDALGLPISQLQLLGTLFSFSVEGINALKRSGVRLSTYQMEAYIHVWNLVGHQIGIQSDLLPLSWADSQELWDHRRRTEYGPTPEGRELTKAAIACMQELFGFTQLPGLPATGIRHYLGNETADMLGVPKADWTRVIFELMYRTDQFYEFALVRLPGTGPIASMLGRRIWQGFELYGRDGQRPAFQVTDELKDAWGMKSR